VHNGGTTIDLNAVNFALYDEDYIGTFGGHADWSFGRTGRALQTWTGAYLSIGGVWTNLSDVTVKSDIVDLDSQLILEKVAQLPITEWSYNEELQDGIRHIGPMAQDFYAAFGLGDGETSIGTVDADGVALVSIQALYDRHRQLQSEKDAEIAELQAANTELQRRVALLEGLATRLAALEAQVGVAAAAGEGE